MLKKMIRRARLALRPSKDKWFDLTDLEIIGGAIVTLCGGWLVISFICAILH